MRGLKHCLIPCWSFFFFSSLNSHSKAPHHPASHPSHLPAASISKFLSILEYYINFRELWKPKYVSVNTSVASSKAVCQFFSSVSILFIRDLVCHRSGKMAQVPLDYFRLMLKKLSGILTQLEIRCPGKHLFISQKHFSFYVEAWATCSPNHWKCERQCQVCLSQGWRTK